MKFESGLRGSLFDFPVVLKKIEGLGYKDYTVETQDELIEIIGEALNREDNIKKKLTQICEEIGLYDTVNLLDQRTLQLISLYKFYKHSPEKIDNSIFFDAVNILQEYEIRMF